MSVDKYAFENSGHPTVNRSLGRLICWLAFGVGGEYLAKGAGLLHGLEIVDDEAKVLSPPREFQDVHAWSTLARKQDPSLYDKEVSLCNLGTLAVRFRKVAKLQDRNFVASALSVLASKFRNREAHKYVKDVRDKHYYLTATLFIPAFNLLLASLDQQRLRVSTTVIGPTGEPAEETV